jgi:hypothetical protein
MGSLIKFILSIIPKNKSIHDFTWIQKTGKFSFEKMIPFSYFWELTPFHVNLSKQNFEVLKKTTCNKHLQKWISLCESKRM